MCRRRLDVALALGLALTTAALVGPASSRAATTTTDHAGTRTAGAGCHLQGSRTLARSRRARLLGAGGDSDGEYTTASTLLGCLRSRGRVVRLQHFGEGTAVTISLVAFAGDYVAFREILTSEPCSKYTADASCSSTQLVSFNLRTGRRRVRVVGQDTPRLVVVTRGWIAWFVPATTAAAASIRAADSLGRRTLDDGPVTAGSLRASGNVVAWGHDRLTRQAWLE